MPKYARTRLVLFILMEDREVKKGGKGGIGPKLIKMDPEKLKTCLHQVIVKFGIHNSYRKYEVILSIYKKSDK